MTPSASAAPARDARGIAAVHVESWRSAYAGILPDRVMVQMSVDQKAVGLAPQLETTSKSQGRAGGRRYRTAAWSASPAAAAPATALAGFDGEIYMLYVLPDWQEQGLGRGLLCNCLQLHRPERLRRGPGLGAGGQPVALLLRGDGRQAASASATSPCGA